MNKKTKRVVGGLVIAAGSVGALAALVVRKNDARKNRKAERESPPDVWARPGMTVTFRAELMPAQDRVTRTFRIKELLPSGRVLLDRTGGEHAENEFEQPR